MKQDISATSMHDVIRYRGNGKISDDTNDEKDDVTCIRSTEECIAIHIDLFNIDAEHVLLYLGDDAAEDVGYGQPQEYVDIACDPDRECIL